MKVLHILKTSVGAKWAFLQMRELVKLGVEVHVALPPGGSLVSQYQNAGIQVHFAQLDFPLRKPWCLPKIFEQMNSLVDEIEPDLLHSHFVGTTLTMRLALGRQHPLPRIFQVPGPLHLESTFFRHSEIATAGKNDYWVGSCQWTSNRYRASGLSSEHVFLSYYGTDLDQFRLREKGKLRQCIGIDSDVKLVGMVAYMYSPKRYMGQHRGLKGHEDLIDALKLLIDQEPKTIGVFVGGAWNGAINYEQQVRDYGTAQCGDRVIFLGNRSDVVDLYPDFDVVVHPSHSENVGGAVESLLLEVPTITTNTGGFPDLVKDGQTGWLVSPHQPIQLAMCIARVLSQPDIAKAVAENGRQLARKMFDVRETAQEIYSIYGNILNQQCASKAL